MIKETPAKTLASAIAALAMFVADGATWIDGEGVEWTYEVKSDETVCIGGDGSMAAVPQDTEGALTIPSEIDGRRVTEIASGAFRYCEWLTSVTIPDGVTDLRSSIFIQCTSLKEVRLPAGITEIPSCMFTYCEAMTRVVIPDSVTVISSHAYFRCTALKEVVFGACVQRIGAAAFGGCSSLESLTLPSGLQELRDYVFKDCHSLKKISFLGDVPSVSDDTFIAIPSDCTVTALADRSGWPTQDGVWNGVKFLRLQPDGGPYTETVDGVTFTFHVENGEALVGSKVFCTPAIPYKYQGAVTIPPVLGNRTVTLIGDWALRYCEGVTAVTIPDTVRSIGKEAFQGCSASEIVLPSALREIGYYGFGNCGNLKSVTFKSAPTIDRYAFAGCMSLQTVFLCGERPPQADSTSFNKLPSSCKVCISGNMTDGPSAGDVWNGFTCYSLVENNAVYSAPSEIPVKTALRPGAEITVSPLARTMTDEQIAELKSRVSIVPRDVRQKVEYFNLVAAADAEGRLTFSTALDLEAMEFTETTKDILAQMQAGTEGENVTLTLPNAKAGFWYGITAAGDLASLSAATGVDAAGQASDGGLSLTLSKPQGASAFFKVKVSDSEPAR